MAAEDDEYNVEGLEDLLLSDDEGVGNGSEEQMPITLERVREMKKELRVNLNMSIIREVIRAFNSAVSVPTGKVRGPNCRISADPELFNALVRLCLGSVIDGLLRLQPRSKRWQKNTSYIRSFLLNIIVLSKGLSDSNDLEVLVLRHIRKSVRLYAEFPNLEIKLVRHLVSIWSTSLNRFVQFTCFACLHGIASHGEENAEAMQRVLKRMYDSYESSTRRFTAENEDLVEFMQNSFAEICSINPANAYSVCFVYLRDMAVKLRKAIRNRNTEISNTITMPFSKILELITVAICKLKDNASMKMLVFPLLSILQDTIDVCGSGVRYFPMKFQCISLSCKLAAETKVYAISPWQIVKLLNDVDLNRTTKEDPENKDKSVNFKYCVKLKKSQTDSLAFLNATVDAVYDALLALAYRYGYSVCFPEMFNRVTYMLAKLSGQCVREQHRTKLKSLAERINEQTLYITQMRRSTASIDLRDPTKLENWQITCRAEGNAPLMRFYEQYQNLMKRKQVKADQPTTSKKRRVNSTQ